MFQISDPVLGYYNNCEIIITFLGIIYIKPKLEKYLPLDKYMNSSNYP